MEPVQLRADPNQTIQFFICGHEYFSDLIEATWDCKSNQPRGDLQFILICGSTLCHLMKLPSRNEDSGFVTLGDHLMKVAEAGTKIYVNVWKPESDDSIIINTITGESESKLNSQEHFSSHPNIQFRFSDRKLEKLGGDLETSNSITHHQKSVFLGYVGGKMIGYTGGMDLTLGRYDTISHPLKNTYFSELYHTEFKHDENCTVRTPWRDIQVRIDGGVSLFLLSNFLERWECDFAILDPDEDEIKRFYIDRMKERNLPLYYEEDDEEEGSKETNESEKEENESRKKLEEEETEGEEDDDEPENDEEKKSENTEEINVIEDQQPRICELVGKDEGWCEVHDEGWCARIIRSIDHCSTNRRSGKENSILQTYKSLIYSADEYIYIENQFFMGGAKYWKTEKRFVSNNPIPVYILNKILSKIYSKMDFVVIVVIPRSPWDSEQSQNNFCQKYLMKRTIEWMYSEIQEAIERMELEMKTPMDYLKFFSLGKVNKKKQKNMIFVHSKMMIVDDKYCVVGSANINDRSIRGDVDTEIGIVACQCLYEFVEEDYHTIYSEKKKKKKLKYRVSSKANVRRLRRRIFQSITGLDRAGQENSRDGPGQRDRDGQGRAEGEMQMDWDEWDNIANENEKKYQENVYRGWKGLLIQPFFDVDGIGRVRVKKGDSFGNNYEDEMSWYKSGHQIAYFSYNFRKEILGGEDFIIFS